MLAHLPPHVLRVDGEPEPTAAAPRGSSPHGRVERQIAVVGARKRAREYFPRRAAERAVTVADLPFAQLVRQPRLVEDTRRVD